MTGAPRSTLEPLALADSVRRAIGDLTAHSVVLRVTAVLLMLHGGSTPAMNVPLYVVGGAILLLPQLTREPLLWWTLVGALVVGNLGGWYVVDNHKYLITYWAMACAVSLHVSDPESYLATMSRALIALVFGFAVLWKVVGGEYLNGSFLYWTLLTDPRVDRVGAALVGSSVGEVNVDSEAVRVVGALGAQGVNVHLLTSQALRVTALVASWMVLVGEASISVVHAFGGSRMSAARHTLLVGFVVGTYFLLPVVGFAFVLAVMGLAQCRPTSVRGRAAYLALLVVVQFTALRWQFLIPVN